MQALTLAERRDVELEIGAFNRLQSWLSELDSRAKKVDVVSPERERLEVHKRIAAQWRDRIRDDIGDLLLYCERLKKKNLTIRDVIEFTVERLNWEISALVKVRQILLDEDQEAVS